MKKGWWWYIATWFGAGKLPISGTMGSLAALPFAYVIHITCGNLALLAAAVIMFFIGWKASVEYLKANPENQDPGEIVVDEVAAQWLLLGMLYPTAQSYLVAFILFRIFDIIKPWPVCIADQKVKGAFGVMLDDILAALYPLVIAAVIMIIAQLMGSQTMLTPITQFLGGAHVS